MGSDPFSRATPAVVDDDGKWGRTPFLGATAAVVGPSGSGDMLGTLSLWSQRRKLRSSIGRDPLSPGDPQPWLASAGTLLELRTRCPQPGWLAHCAYWAGVPMKQIAIGAVGI